MRAQGNERFVADRYGGRATILLGDEEADRFVPRLTARRFASPLGRATEQRLSIWAPVQTAQKRSATFVDGVVEWAEGPLSARRDRFYTVTRDGDDSSVEWEIVYAGINDVPAVIELNAEFPAGCSAWLQPALTQQESKDGCVRPEAMVGGYVFSVPQNGRWLDRNKNEIVNYETGRWGHVLRPTIMDETGTPVYCDWEAVDVATGKLRLLVPEKFRRTAKGQITLGPTFGYTSIGGSTLSSEPNYIYAAGPYSPASNGNATSVSAYINSFGAAQQTLGLYDESASEPHSLLADSAGGGGESGVHWVTQTLDSSPAVTTGSNYWLAINSNYGGQWFYDSVGGFGDHFDSQTYSHGALLATFVSEESRGSRKFSAYVTYTEAAAGIVRRKIDGGLAGPGLVHGGVVA